MLLRITKQLTNSYLIIGYSLVLFSFAILLIPYYPYLYYGVNRSATAKELESLSTPLSQPGGVVQAARKTDSTVSDISNVIVEKKLKEPEVDPNLPKENYVIISKIGVNAKINEGADAKKSLEKGVWRVNDYGEPDVKNNIPTILASHRFGDIRWSSSFREQNSFYNLPDLVVGDRIEIIWGQKRYVYEIVDAMDSTYIENYNYDLILYTCRMIDSPVRVFRFANRVE